VGEVPLHVRRRHRERPALRRRPSGGRPPDGFDSPTPNSPLLRQLAVVLVAIVLGVYTGGVGLGAWGLV